MYYSMEIDQLDGHDQNKMSKKTNKKVPSIGDSHIDFPQVLVEDSVETFINEHVGKNLDNEVCGILLGVTEQIDGIVVHVTRAIEGKFATQNEASVTFTHKTWDYFHEEIDKETGYTNIVGWYHSHPGFGVFYSSHDSFIQQNFFSDESQVGIVVDPTNGDWGIFANLQSGIEGIPHYLNMSESERKPIEVTCNYVDKIAAKVDVSEEEEMATLQNQLLLLAKLVLLESQLSDLRKRNLRLFKYILVILIILTVAAGLFGWLQFAEIKEMIFGDWSEQTSILNNLNGDI